MSDRGPPDAEKTAIGPRPVFDDEHETRAGAERPRITPAQASQGPTITRSTSVASSPPSRSERRKLELPKVGASRLTLPPVEVATGDLPPDPAESKPAERIELLQLEPAPTVGLNTAGPLTFLAVALVVVVAVVFIRGTRSGDGTPVVQVVAPVPAGQRSLPARPRTWQDRFRSENPDLLVGSPKLPYLSRDPLRRVRKRPRPRRPVANGLQWTPERVAKASLPTGMSPNLDVPGYEEHGIPPQKVTPAPTIRVFTIPPGARVEMGDRVLGVTPFVRPRIPDTAYGPVTLRKPGYETVVSSLREGPNDSLVLDLKLKPTPAPKPAQPVR